MDKETLIKNIQINYPKANMEKVYEAIESSERKGYSYEGMYLLYKACNDPDAIITLEEIQQAFNISNEKMSIVLEKMTEKYGDGVLEEFHGFVFIMNNLDME